MSASDESAFTVSGRLWRSSGVQRVVIAALLLGIATGMRTFTGLAALAAVRGMPSLFFVAMALAEDGADLLPQAPDRTAPPGLAARMIAALAVGWLAAGLAGSVIAAAGALVGAFGGLRLRRRLIARAGAIPAGLIESSEAAALAVAAALLPKTIL